MILNMVGGGSQLNYEVVGGTTQPTSPNTNTIWIKTSTAIPSHCFSPYTQTKDVAGRVWMKTGSAGGVAFDALKDNDLTVNLLGATQCISGKYEQMEAYIYTSSAWTKFSDILTDIIAYNAGTKNVALTLSNVTEAASYLNATLAKGGNASVTVTAQDITKHKTVKVTYSNLSGDGTFAGNIQIRILDANGSQVKATTETNNASGTLSLDISSLSGSHKVQVYMWNTSGSYTGSCRISKIEILQ